MSAPGTQLGVAIIPAHSRLRQEDPRVQDQLGLQSELKASLDCSETLSQTQKQKLQLKCNTHTQRLPVGVLLGQSGLQ